MAGWLSFKTNQVTAPQGRTRALLTGTLVLFTLVGYQNCGSDFVASDSLSFSSMSASQCSARLQAAFEQSFRPFVSTNCKACHVPGGVGKGAFASPDPDLAFNAFMLDTPEQVENHAVDPSHAAGYTGPANASAIQTAKAIWDAAQTSCSDGTDVANTSLVTVDKPINGSATVKTITFNLDTDIVAPHPSYGGATFTIGVQEVTNISGDTLYYFTAPTVKTGTVPLQVGKITMRINGQDQSLMTTYTQLIFTVPASSSQNMCTTTGTNPFTFAASDTLGVKFGLLSTSN